MKIRNGIKLSVKTSHLLSYSIKTLTVKLHIKRVHEGEKKLELGFQQTALHAALLRVSDEAPVILQ